MIWKEGKRENISRRGLVMKGGEGVGGGFGGCNGEYQSMPCHRKYILVLREGRRDGKD
jgi:hypothetical protein